MELVVTVIVCAVVLAIATAVVALSGTIVTHHRLRAVEDQRDKLRRELEHEHAMRTAYERGLGLASHNPQIVDQELWQRASEGDELAQQILEARMMRRAELELWQRDEA